MFKKSTIQLLRFPFSFFLMPVYWFALGFIDFIFWKNAVIIFLLIHILLYPSSNGYNSYMDRDTSSIGGIKNPLQPTRQLYFVSLAMDFICVVFAWSIAPFISYLFIIYIIFSRLYSSRITRLKRFPVIGYITVITNQGALIFYLVYIASGGVAASVPLLPMLVASLLIGGFYPITQIYQHKEDAADNVKTISMLLGKKGTFVFCILIYTIAFSLLFYWYLLQAQLLYFWVMMAFFTPISIYFATWAMKVWKDEGKADFENTMKMNLLASTCTNLAFITILILKQRG